MRVTLLGTIGWMPSDRRETTCFACRTRDSLFIFDAGTGLRRLREPAQAALLDGARDAHLFLTHYHLDHVCGLAYLPGVLPGRGLVIHAPAAELNGVDPERAGCRACAAGPTPRATGSGSPTFASSPPWPGPTRSPAT